MIDLHCHSDCSDGSDSPIELIRLAAGMGLRVLAITDHDTLDGYDLAKSDGSSNDCSLLCGVELSTKSERSSRSVHLLGYFFEDPGPQFRKWLMELQNGRRERNALLQQRLLELGMDIPLPELEAIGKKQIGRPHFARLMVERGYVASVREAFDQYLAEDKPAFIDRNEPAAEEAVERVNHAGGVATLAHPGRITHDACILRALIADLVPHGLKALECFHPEHLEEDTRLCLAFAREYNLAVTGGSDYHGSYKPAIRLGTGKSGGQRLPLSLFNDLSRRFAETDPDRCNAGLSGR